MGSATPQLCRKLLHYEPETGKLFWLPRPREMFSSQRSFKMWHTRYAGHEAFTADDGRGYRNGSILYETLLAHRVVWAIVHGAWPDGEIDHINGDRSDNRLENLRPATAAENQRNQGLPSNNVSGILGVSWNGRRSRWQAKINVGGKTKWLGYFDTLEQAASARAHAEASNGFADGHGKRPAHNLI